MTDSSIGVAVIGAGMAGRAHAAGYRSASTVYGEGLPEIRLAAIADVNPAFAADTARRFGFERAEGGWEAVAAADDVDVVSVVVANPLHRQIVEGLLDAGKHVLCEKPMAPTVEDAEAMVAAAKASGRETGIGFVFRRSPAIGAIREQLASGAIGPAPALQRPLLVRLRGRPAGPDELALQGRPGVGRPVRHRQPPDRPGRVRLRPHPVGPGRGAVHLRHRARPAPGRGRRPRRRRAQRRHRAGGERGPGHLHGHLRVRRHRHPFGLPGRLRPGQLPRLRAVHLGGRGHLRPGPGRRVRLHRRRPGRRDPGLPPGAGRARPPVPHRGHPDGLPRASATGRTTCSPSRPGPSSSRSPGWRGSRGSPPSPRACTTSACWTRSSPRPRPAAPTWPSTDRRGRFT